MLHGQFDNSVQTRNHLNKLTSLYDLSLFNLDSNLNINPLVNLSNLQFRSRYFSPHSLVQTNFKISQNVLSSSFSIFHNNVVSLNGNLENLQTYILEELGISETKITNSNVVISTPLISGYNFELHPTSLPSGGVALFIDEKHNYRVLEETSNKAFQALWVEIPLAKKKNVICGSFIDNITLPNASSSTLTNL